MSEKRTLLQKILLGLLAAMTVLFAVLTGVNRSQPLVQWGGSLLRPAEEGNAAVYTSAVYGEDIAIRVWPDGADTVVEFTVGSRLRQTGRVTWPEGTISREHGGDVPRIEVFLDGASIFSGGCDRDSGALYLEDGSREIGPLVHYFTSYSSSWDNFALEASDVVRFALGPDTVCRGSWTAYALGVFFSRRHGGFSQVFLPLPARPVGAGPGAHGLLPGHAEGELGPAYGSGSGRLYLGRHRDRMTCSR